MEAEDDEIKFNREKEVHTSHVYGYLFGLDAL